MIKSVVDLRNNFGRARDQHPRPTCMAFAASDAHAAARSGWDPLSTEWAFYHALKRDGGQPDDGVTLNSMLVTIKSDGQPVEAEWPYIKAPIADVKSWKPPALSKRKLFYRDHKTCSVSMQDVIDKLNSNTAVLITMTISDAFYLPDVDGIVESNEPIDARRHHAVVAVGHGNRGKDQFGLIRNSWGEAWGLHGCAWISLDYLKPRLTGAAIMTAEL